METIKVNMTPCEDIKTIHASQNDSEAREWGFELHNNGELIDTSEVKEQMVFKAYKDGTEQLLPENGSTPTTSPFKGDIRYPQGLLTDQEFTYRQSPTEEDGLAYVVGIKGQTLKWNQLVRVDSIATSSYYGITNTKVDDYTIRLDGTATSNYQARIFWTPRTFAPNHVYAIGGTKGKIAIVIGNSYGLSFKCVIKPTTSTESSVIAYIPNGTTFSNEDFQIQIFDLTLMFGDTKAEEIFQMEQTTTGSGLAYFKSLFPLNYYPYNSGSLIPFNGNGIKTVGFNQWDEEWESGTIGNDGSKVSSVSRIRSKNYIPVLPNTTYYTQINNYSIPLYACLRYAYDADKNPIDVIRSNYSVSFTTPSNCHYILFSPNAQYGTTYNNDICINISDTERNGQYEPYTSSTLSLPISTYFPTGMKSKGDVYDELTETKAITRIGSRAYQSGDESDTSVITDGTTTYYALVTPTETSFTTASLVTENAEIPLSNEDGTLIGKCTEQLSENPGFIDAKIKLTDSDGECYSNKLQLHIERSPQ